VTGGGNTCDGYALGLNGIFAAVGKLRDYKSLMIGSGFEIRNGGGHFDLI